MQFRIHAIGSSFKKRLGLGLLSTCVTASVASIATEVTAQSPSSGYQVDDSTGIAYAPVRKTVSRPVQETRMVTRQQTTYSPRLVTETRPTTRTTFVPTTQTTIEPYVANRWNPFVRPSLAYRFVPRTTWHAQTDVVNQTTVKTEYVAETRTMQVPETVNRIKQEEQLVFEPVGSIRSAPQVDPKQAALAARLRPLGSSERFTPFGSNSLGSGTQIATLPRSTTAPRIASSSVSNRANVLTSPSQRSSDQTGQPATDLTLRGNRFGQSIYR